MARSWRPAIGDRVRLTREGEAAGFKGKARSILGLVIGYGRASRGVMIRVIREGTKTPALYSSRFWEAVDHCELCFGARRGVPGNENRIKIAGRYRVVCDNCHADRMGVNVKVVNWGKTRLAKLRAGQWVSDDAPKVERAAHVRLYCGTVIAYAQVSYDEPRGKDLGCREWIYYIGGLDGEMFSQPWKALDTDPENLGSIADAIFALTDHIDKGREALTVYSAEPDA